MAVGHDCANALLNRYASTNHYRFFFPLPLDLLLRFDLPVGDLGCGCGCSGGGDGCGSSSCDEKLVGCDIVAAARRSPTCLANFSVWSGR
jgi:hypothetical protein